MTPAHRPPRVAIVGAGPSGLFAAQALLAGRDDVLVDVLDRLPTPFGLVRYGVAPDHTSIKAVQRALAAPFESARVRFFGLVEFGTTISRDELVAGYDAVVYAVGASEDRRLGVPGEDLPGSRSACEFVAWYSGHPDAEPQRMAGVRSVVAFGVGNVALDVARILLADPAHLDRTDMPEPVLAELSANRVSDVWVIGRRGPQHASFTTPELREVLALDGVEPVIRPGDLAGIDETGLDRRVRGNLEALRGAAGRVVDRPRARLHLVVWRRPVEVLGADAVTGVALEATCLDDSGELITTGDREVVTAQLVLRAIGYRANPLPGVPFDERSGVVPNAEGRVLGEGDAVRPGEYVVGWIKRGPVGVIGTIKSAAAATVSLLLADLAQRPGRAPGPDAGEVLAGRGVAASTFADWERIDAAEVDLGSLRGRARTKVETWHGLTELVRFGRAGGPLEHEPCDG